VLNHLGVAIRLGNGVALNYFLIMGKTLKPPTLAGTSGASRIDALAMTDDLVCTHTSLRRAARRLGQLYDEAISPTGLTSPQALLLAQIDKLGAVYGEEGPPLQVLAGRLAIGVSALTHALRPLVREGLVELRPDARDRRTKHGVLTPLGRARFQEMVALWGEASERVEAVLGDKETEALRRLADTVASQQFLDAYNQGTIIAPTKQQSGP